MAYCKTVDPNPLYGFLFSNLRISWSPFIYSTLVHLPTNVLQALYTLHISSYTLVSGKANLRYEHRKSNRMIRPDKRNEPIRTAKRNSQQKQPTGDAADSKTKSENGLCLQNARSLPLLLNLLILTVVDTCQCNDKEAEDLHIILVEYAEGTVETECQE